MHEEFSPPFVLAGEAAFVQPLNNLIRHAEELTEKKLEADRSTDALAQAVKEIQIAADADSKALLAAIAASAASDPAGRIQCRSGCCHCCYRVPEASVPEIARIWSHLTEKFSDEDRALLRKRIDRYLDETSAYRPSRLGDARPACPMLVDSRCSIYEARPFSCRGLNSTNASVCETIRLGKPFKDRPIWADLVYHAMALRMGVRLGAFFEGMEPETVDVGYALRVLFENPEAMEAYVEGKDTFRESRSSSECETFAADQIAKTNGPAYHRPSELDLPSGNLDADEAASLGEQTTKYLETGDFQTYLENLEGGGVGSMMARVNVPRVAMSEEEIDEWRLHYVRAMQEFEESDAPAECKFNALSFHQTMNLTYQGRDDVDILRRHGRWVVEGISAKALPQFARSREGKRKPGKLRVGYISGHLNRSNNGRWAWTWVKHHSDEIETFCFLVGSSSDQYTDLFRDYSDHFYWLKRSVPSNAATIRSLDLDVVIFTDIGLYARMTQYSSLRLARVQCAAWGGPSTSGLPTIDYYLSSEYMEPPDGDRHYTEKLVKLPRTAQLLYRENNNAAPQLDRAYFGLPESGRLMLMAQACMKLTPRHDHLLAEICERSGCSIVLLESNPPGDSAIVKERLRRAGVRATWLPSVSSSEYLSLMRLADVSIDPPMWSGGNTTVQAISLGTPVVTLPGPFMRGRHSLAFLRQANGMGLVAADEEDFVGLVCDFDRQREALNAMEPNALYGDVGVLQALDEFIFSVAES